MAAASTSLKEYLKKYQSEPDDQSKKKKKKKTKNKPRANPMGAGVLVVDEDPVWQKPIVEEEEESADDEVPQIEEDIEVKRMRRLEAVRARNRGIAEDGSGWVAISDQKASNCADGDSDLSPPSQRRPRFDTPSPAREQDADDSKDVDLSPPRQRRRRLDTPSPEPKIEVDLSPPRQRRRRLNTPLQEPKVEVDADMSPPQRKSSEDLSPPRRNRNRSPEVDADLSPRSRNQLPEVNGDLSPPRRSSKSSVYDLSPPRRALQQFSEDLRRRGSSAVDLSPQRRRKEPSLAKDGDLSPQRKRQNQSSVNDEDLSPPRKKQVPYLAKESRRTGLLSADEIRKEIERKKKEDALRFASMDPSMTGQGAEVVFRDKEGRRIKKEELLKAHEEEKPKEKKLEWGKGLAQKREAEDKMKELELEKEKPFARTRDDPDLDKMLKERIRWGDPMAHLVKRKSSEPVLEDLGTDEKMKESGFIIPQSIPSHSWIKRGIDFPPNRYGIRPGRHWDGVDRSNGYEKGLFKRQNEKRATESEAYLWSVADM